MHHFHYLNGALACEGVPLKEIADAVGTPVYVYSTATLTRHFSVLNEAFSTKRTAAGMTLPGALIAYSVKANGNLSVLATLARLGAGADIVSAGEMQRALKAGIPPARIVFSGVGKTEEELVFALKTGIHLFNVESQPEMHRLSRLASALGLRAPVAYRVNPHVAAGGHANISTGKPEDKFGIAWHEAEALYREALGLPGLDVVGVDVHIGSQIQALAPLEEAFCKVVDLVHHLRALGAPISRVDLGGGLGIPYSTADSPASPADYAAMIGRVLDGLDVSLILEPGRVIAGNAGVLVAQVEYIKERDGRRFVILDTAMNDLMRPALYGAHHDVLPLNAASDDAPLSPADLVGPVCESTDRFAKDRPLPPLSEGDRIAFLSAGAYGAVMSSQYNARPLVPEVLVDGDSYQIVRRRPSFEDMIALETPVEPARLSAAGRD
jgi:diaminopimelate decarboxylase